MTVRGNSNPYYDESINRIRNKFSRAMGDFENPESDVEWAATDLSDGLIT